MFKLEDKVTYWWPVKVQMPEGGKFTPHIFEVQFETLTPDEGKKLVEDANGEFDPILKRVIKGWREVKAADGTDLAFNEDSLAKMLGLNWARLGLYEAWNDSHMPEQRRTGN